MRRTVLLFTRSGLLAYLMFLMSVPSYSQYRITEMEEFKINSLLDVDIMDYSPKSKLYLGFVNAAEGERILLINTKGEIIEDRNLKGEGPNQYVSNLNCMGFSEDGDIWLQTVTHVLQYDQSLVLKKRTPYPSTVKMHIYGRKEAFPYFYKDGSKAGFSFVTNPSGTNSYMPNVEVTSDLIEVYDSGEDELYKMAPISDRLISGKLAGTMMSSLYFIVYSMDRGNHRLLLTTRLDDEITVYNVKTRKLESKMKIKHGEFAVLKLNSISTKDLSSVGNVSLEARNHKLLALDGNLSVLDYVREIPYGIYEQKKADDPTYHHTQDAAYHRLILFDDGKQVSGDIPMPKNGKLMLGLPGNHLLFKLVDPDTEEDFIRYGVFKIVRE